VSVYTDLITSETSCLSLWPFSDLTGSVATDLKGSKNGAYQAAPTLGVLPGAIVGDGSTCIQTLAASLQYVSVAAPNQPAAVSYEIWVRNMNGGSGWTDLGGVGQWNTNGALLYFESGSGVQGFVNAGALTNPPNAALLVGWHYGFGYDGTTGDLVIDGQIVQSGPLTGPITYAGNFEILQYGAPSGTYGTVQAAMAAHYNARLTAAQWLAHYSAGVSGAPGSTIVKRLRNPLNIH